MKSGLPRKQNDQRVDSRHQGTTQRLLLAGWESDGDVGKRSNAGPLPRCTCTPYWTSTSQTCPAKIDPQVPLGARGALACNGVRRERITPASAHRCSATSIWDPAAHFDGPAALRLWDPTPQTKAPLALASLVLGSRRKTGLCEIGYGEFARRRGHETRAPRARPGQRFRCWF